MRVTDYNRISSGAFEARYRYRKYPGIEAALSSFASGARQARVLEVGSGTGHWLAVLADAGYQAVGLELSSTMLAESRRQVPSSRLVQGDAARLPFPDGTFDRVFSVNALHHFPDKPAFMNEVRRVLVSSGGVMSIGLDPHENIRSWWVYDYFPETKRLDQERFPRPEEIQAGLARAGFVRIDMREVDHIDDTMSLESARGRGYLDRSFTSQFTILTTEEFQRGLDRLANADQAASAAGTTVLLRSDLRFFAATAWVR